MHDFWPSSGFAALHRDARGWMVPGDDWWRTTLAQPQLALIDESCAAEVALHRALVAEPRRAVTDDELAALADDDVRHNYRLWLRFRDSLLAGGTLEAWYLALMRGGRIDLPPLFIDQVVRCIVRNLLDDTTDAFEARAAELLFRAQRVTLHGGALLAGDADTLNNLNADHGLGAIGRLLVEAGASLRSADLQVLGADNSAAYWSDDTRSRLLLDLSHEITHELGHGLQFKLSRARSGLQALAKVLQKWVAHLLGVAVRIVAVQRIDDDAWRWHVGLDAESSALLNDLYDGREVDSDRLSRLIGLFRLEFTDAMQMRTDVAGKPVYLGLAMSADGVLKLKPQNLLLNLPLKPASAPLG